MDLLRHLRFFVKVAETRHFGQAAVELGMTQPPLSQGIQRLERRLGVRLFDRDARGVRITTAGQNLLPRAEDLLAAADRMLADTAAWSAARTARVGLPGDLGGRIDDCVSAVSAGGLPVLPVVSGSVDLVDLVKDGELDAAVVRHPGIIDGTAPGPVTTLPTRVLGPSSPAPVRIADVGLPLAVPPRRHQPPAHDQLVDALRRAGHTGEVVEEEDPLARRALVAARRAITLSAVPGEGVALADPLPLRFRVVLPVPARRRADVDHDWLATALGGALQP